MLTNLSSSWIYSCSFLSLSPSSPFWLVFFHFRNNSFVLPFLSASPPQEIVWPALWAVAERPAASQEQARSDFFASLGRFERVLDCPWIDLGRPKRSTMDFSMIFQLCLPVFCSILVHFLFHLTRSGLDYVLFLFLARVFVWLLVRYVDAPCERKPLRALKKNKIQNQQDRNERTAINLQALPSTIK